MALIHTLRLHARTFTYIRWPVFCSNFKTLKNNKSLYQMTSFQWADDNVSSSSSITPKFVLPETHRPNLEDISRETIPVIDMNEDHDILVQKIAEACENFGFFQITNHGVKEELCAKVLDVITTFFELSHEKKSHLVSSDHMEDGKIFKYYVKTEEDKIIPMWSEALFHTWDPVDHSYTSNLPQDPTCYRYICTSVALLIYISVYLVGTN